MLHKKPQDKTLHTMVAEFSGQKCGRESAGSGCHKTFADRQCRLKGKKARKIKVCRREQGWCNVSIPSAWFHSFLIIHRSQLADLNDHIGGAPFKPPTKQKKKREKIVIASLYLSSPNQGRAEYIAYCSSLGGWAHASTVAHVTVGSQAEAQASSIVVLGAGGSSPRGGSVCTVRPASHGAPHTRHLCPLLLW